MNKKTDTSSHKGYENFQPLDPEELEIEAAAHLFPESEILRDRDNRFDEVRIIGETPGMLKLKRSIRRASQLDCPVLLCGEPGTGRELTAKTIHQFSRRSGQPFVTVDCTSIGEDLLRRELFGRKHSDSTRMKRGLLEVSQGGTLLLENFESVPLGLHQEIQFLMEKGIFIPIGGTEERLLQSRIMVSMSTQADLPIRKDLPVPDFADRPFILFIPSLQERIEDIPLLANLFLDRFRCEYGKKIIGFSKEAMKTLLAYSYPGNVLELENAVERAVILCQGVEITPASLPPNFLRKQHHVEPDSLVTMAELEKQHIRNVLLHTGGNKNEAAEILDISRTSLWRKLKQMGES